MTTLIGFLNTVIWGYVLIYGLLAVGVYFTVRLSFVQFRHFGEMFRRVIGPGERDKDGISPYQALVVSLASRVGTGNIAGVAIALYLGGPCAVFWMWMVALVGMASAYSESTLAQLYKTHGADGTYRGGPAFYIARGLGRPWLGAVFAICLITAFGLVFNAVQANSIADAFQGAFGVPKLGTGVAVAALTGLVIFGGVRQIARVEEYVVPLMAGIYLLAATATPDPHHPSSQGFVQALGVFIDTILVCTATAVVILLSGVLDPTNGVTGTALTQAALTHHFGPMGATVVAVATFLFAFTSVIGNYAYCESAMGFLDLGAKPALMVLRVLVLAMVIWGSLQAVTTVFDFADAWMGLMATINLIAIVVQSGVVVKLTRDYAAQRKAGKLPKFHIADDPEIWK